LFIIHRVDQLVRALLAFVLLSGMGMPHGMAAGAMFTWTCLVPENDSRPRDVRAEDEFSSNQTVVSMNQTEKVFHGQLEWRCAKIKDLLSISAPFCEFDFDAVKPQYLTAREKSILREYLSRGGFILLAEDGYPYTQEEFLKVRNWPVIDFFLKELPALDPGFKVEKLTDKHPIYHQYYDTKILPAEIHEFALDPYLPDLQLLSYRGHPCAFVYANYFCDHDSWVTAERPYPVMATLTPEDYALDVNLYLYVTSH